MGRNKYGQRFSAVIICPVCHEYTVRFVMTRLKKDNGGYWRCSLCYRKFEAQDRGRRLMSDQQMLR